jgi:uncharacterized protein
MRCPTDETTLVMSERNGIEIDYCPQCRGVWLDRGELDKIIERAGAGQPAAYAAPQSQPQYPAQRSDDRGYGYGSAPQQPYRKKKENWLSELFD